MDQIYMTRQRRPTAQRGAEDLPASTMEALPNRTQNAAWESSLNAIQEVRPHEGRRLSLDAAMSSRMQEQFGIRMDQVELRESSQPADMDAKAFAKGNVVQFAPGQFRPDTEHGQQLIQHELAHVAQQARGGVRADVEGLNVNADEGLEHQADLGNVSAGAGAPVSVGGLNAEAAPVQGLFGGIKRFFKKVGRSRKAGHALDERDQAVKEMTAQHNAEQDEITAVMKKQGYTDQEIQAQLMFQRVNQNQGRLSRYQDALAAVRDSDVESPEEMDNFHARSARGALRKSSRERRAQREEDFRNNVLAGNSEYAQAEQMADSLGRYYTMEAGYKAKADQLRERYGVQREKSRSAYAQNPGNKEIEGIELMYQRQEMNGSDISKVDALERDSERARSIKARSDQFFKIDHPGYVAGTTTRDLVRFLGNGTDADVNVSDEKLDAVYQAVMGSSGEDPVNRQENGRKLLQPLKDSVSVLRSQMAQLGDHHNARPISQNDIMVRYQETAELYKKAQITRDIGSQVLGSGAIQEGDPGYEEFLDDLDYARSVCEYAKGLNSGGKGVEEGTKSPGEVRSFEDAQEEFRQKRRNPR